jgi:hypothetical protein
MHGDRCANCGHPRKEHSHEGACYGLCGAFVELPTGIDASTLSEPDLLAFLGVDAQKWAQAFCQIANKLGYKSPDGEPIDEGWMISWFANAMMAMHDHLRPECAPVRLPDGSAFFVGEVETLPPSPPTATVTGPDTA